MDNLPLLVVEIYAVFVFALAGAIGLAALASFALWAGGEIGEYRRVRRRGGRNG